MARVLSLLAAGFFAMTAVSGATAAEPVAGADVINALTKDDPYIWMEEVEGEKALDWVRKENERSLGVLKGDARYQAFYDQALSILAAKDRIPMPSASAGFIWNFWQDDVHVRGIWRRTTLASYRIDSPAWETILDVDALAKAENENWVFAGANCLEPERKRCLVTLSRGGGDAAVIREFDVPSRSFVAGGFELPEAKSNVDWVDENTVIVGTDFGPGSLTTSGYPRVGKLWKRGTPLSEATTLGEGEATDVGYWGTVVHRPEGTEIFFNRAVTFFESDVFHAAKDTGKLTQLPLPRFAEFGGLFKGQVLFSLREDWTVEGQGTFRKGSYLSFDLATFLATGALPKIVVGYEPDARSAIQGGGATADTLYLEVTENVIGKVYAFTFADGAWSRREVTLPANGDVNIFGGDTFGDTIFFTFRSFLTPDTLFVSEKGGAPENLKQLPARFEATGYIVKQYEATSKDGTKVPYFVVTKENQTGPLPTLLYAYGGFQVSMLPSYSGTVGKLWLERGGAYILANIRGGGEFGPGWHTAGLKTERQRIYDDFIAVAEDAVAKGITTPQQLGIQGGSNGGLLVGVAFTQRPDLFKAVVCQVPLLDMIRYTLLPPGASWIAEYGDPTIEAERAAIAQYSPYQALRKDASYPEVFFMTSTKDDRVHPGHARKMAARMAEFGKPFLYFENIEGGHAGAANLKQRAEQSALAFTYLSQQLGLE